MSQTTSSRKSYNVEALRGGDMDDMEVVEFYGLDPSVAYTPAILDAAVEANYLRRLGQYQNRGGKSREEAEKLAMEGRRSAENDIKMLKRRHKL